MRQVCLFCERTSPDRNLFCHEAYCPAEMSPVILEYGEWLGDIEIVRLVAVLRSSALYEARHHRRRVYLKVAHPGPEHTDRLKREAEFLAGIRGGDPLAAHLPTLLPPYVNTTTRESPYGRAMVGRHLLYFSIFEFVEGEPLRDVLKKTPQPWIFHVGWIVAGLAAAVGYLQLKQRLHLALSPDAALVRFDEGQAPPHVLLFDLGLLTDREGLRGHWYDFAVPPAYLAPELAEAPLRPGFATDVYGLGLILYEMLVGEPAFPYRLRSDAEVVAAVRSSRSVSFTRREDLRDKVADLVARAVARDPAARQPDAATLANELNAEFGHVPRKRQRRRANLEVALAAAVVLLAVAFLLALVTSLGGLAI